MSFLIRKIGMLEMPKIAMLSTKTMSFSIRKIGMLKMPKIAMLSTLFSQKNKLARPFRTGFAPAVC